MEDLGTVIESSLEGAPGRESVAEETPAVETPAPDPTAQGEEQELAALEKDLLAKTPSLRGTINTSRHQAVLTRARNQHDAAVKKIQAELEAAKGYQGKYESVKWAEDEDIRDGLTALALAETDQGAFAKLLLEDPRFASILQLKEAQAEGKAPAGGAMGVTMPPPNVTNPDGSKTYDDKGLAALLEWNAKQAEDRAFKRFEQAFGPVKQQYDASNLWNQTLGEQKGILDNARTNWPGFAQQEPQIKAALAQNKRWDLHDAYREVVIKGYQAQTTKTREQYHKEFIEELNKKKVAASQQKPGAAAERVAHDGPRDLADIIKASLPRE